MVEVTVESIRVSLINQSRLVVLRQTDGSRFLSIWIGAFEADAITVGLQEAEVARPLTHDLLCNVARELGATLTQVRITQLRDESTYIAELVLEHRGQELRVDARPSDAIALAVRRHVPILVSDAVMDSAGQLPSPEYEGRVRGRPTAGREPSGESTDKLDVFRRFVDSLDLGGLGKPPEG